MAKLLDDFPMVSAAGLGWKAEAMTITQRTRRVPCDCATPCGWVHRRRSGSPVLTVKMRPETR